VHGEKYLNKSGVGGGAKNQLKKGIAIHKPALSNGGQLNSILGDKQVGRKQFKRTGRLQGFKKGGQGAGEEKTTDKTKSTNTMEKGGGNKLSREQNKAERVVPSQLLL